MMFLFTWPFDLANAGVMPFHVPFLVSLLVGYGIVLAAIGETWVALGRRGVLDLLGRFLIVRVGWVWFLWALLLQPLLQFLAVWIHCGITRSNIDFNATFAAKMFGPSASFALFVIPFLLVDALTNGEEIGWRGFVLPRLQADYNALAASLMVGIFWGLWHIPKFWGSLYTSQFAWFLLGIMLNAVLYTWLFNSTNGSLLLATLFHASGNTASVFLPISPSVTPANQPAFVWHVVLQAVVVVIVVVATGSANLSRTKHRQMQL